MKHVHPQEELVVLVDDQNNVLGTAAKATVHTSDTPLHRAFSLFLFNEQGEVLLQQRSKHKRTWPLVWSNSCCGHPGPGEALEDAIQRRVMHELGIANVAELRQVVPHFRYRAEHKGIVEHELCPILVGYTSEKPRPNYSEVAQVKWVSWEDFCLDIAKNPTQYTDWCVLEVAELQNRTDWSFLLSKNIC